ncbi:EAL domain-containing protein [Agarivorans aestuarii]|uniref:cyclic-guanylate-specific phosphodiesterase n=1 Tax=Agarivorans aestuarii TaxID=1563703 RepID=A0ABU7G0N4_9ALTE|nr:EAL domain-containing protein [Agarivorans aestuarii]MEE1672514.1 EAL domain-containing protein [Agarivorans aestuarii]
MRIISHRTVVICSGLFACTLMVYLALMVLSSDIQESQRRYAHNTITLNQTVIYDSLQALDDLEKLDINDCSETSLTKMRQTVYLSSFIRDVGLLQNDLLVCTSVGGVLAEPVTLDKPSFTSALGYDIWLNQQLVIFDFLHSGVVIRRGNFNVVIDSSTFAPLEYGDNQWELVSNRTSKDVHLAGTQGIYKDTNSPIYEEVTDNYHYFHRCSENFDFCIALSLYNYTLFKNKTWFLVISILFSLAFGVLASIFSETLFKRHNSNSSRIRRGLRKQYFYYQIQPLVDLKTKRVIGGEVLARFKDPLGELYPDQFIHEISALKLSWPFTLLMIKNALSDLQASGAIQKDCKISFNIFPNDVENNNISELKHLPEVKNFSGNITLEITEDLKLDSLVAIENINNVIKQGFEVAIDDFGTGYSNLAQLKSFRCQYLKIDKSFVFDLEAGSIRSSLVPHMVDIAHKSDLKVIAEGIENIMQSKVLEDLGVEYGQGWMFGKPMSVEKFIEAYQRTNKPDEGSSPKPL